MIGNEMNSFSVFCKQERLQELSLWNSSAKPNIWQHQCVINKTSRGFIYLLALRLQCCHHFH